MRRTQVLFVAFLLAGCAPATDESAASSELSSKGSAASGEQVFDHSTFGGNGRTCSTCHGEGSAFTTSPADAQARYAASPSDALFRSLDSDDGVGSSYTRLLTDATILVHIPLPANVSLAGSSARSATFARAIPTILNIGLDPVLMSDGRAASLQDQATGAINSHFQPHAQPTGTVLDDIAAYERTEFSSSTLAQYAAGGAAPQLPLGNTDSEKRGREFFIDQPMGLCGHCHSGPMLNHMNQFNPPGMPVGTRFFTAFVSELNEAGTPPQTFAFTNPDGSVTTVTSPDPGRALVTGNAFEANLFKIPTLWGVSKTAPYFHDNSARTLEDLVAHYTVMFAILTSGGIQLSAQDQADIVAYMKLL
jgi:cytochrome c peroxidase